MRRPSHSCDSASRRRTAAIIRSDGREAIKMKPAIALALLLVAIVAPLGGAAYAEPNTDDVIEQAP